MLGDNRLGRIYLVKAEGWPALPGKRPPFGLFQLAQVMRKGGPWLQLMPVSRSRLLERAAKAVQRSRKLCADTRRLIEEARDGIARVRRTHRQLETALAHRGFVNSLRCHGDPCPPAHGLVAKSEDKT